MTTKPLLALLVLTAPALAHDHDPAVTQPGAVLSPADASKTPAFDILASHAHRSGDQVTFHMTLAGDAGAERPAPVGDLKAAPVWSYVWPTSLDPATVGFETKSGILALAATIHPDFDDTPLYDETGDGDAANDGDVWHSHWVVLTPNDECGPGALSVRDIPEGEKPSLPATWPGLPLFIDSPDYKPSFDGPEISLTVDLPASVGTEIAYDGVTSALRVNANLHAPLLCVTDVWDVASGDLSLPGKVAE
ncbi:hypothetical protein [Neogemmobacter tilapiae]|uniref:Uncharacterized protein n=1 Tax=Neogemmobacter tilapiae TaxID=875041 RepID=A0A918TZV0_9RHOB|nr:hypothetical protein [Gemmobacter tilapiae]GHC66703.1 hypothetical protein GCM10007315_34460 [Gemmobacter tilapiae]